MKYFTLAFIRGRARVLPLAEKDHDYVLSHSGHIYTSWKGAADMAFDYAGLDVPEQGLFTLPGGTIKYIAMQAADCLKKTG